MTPLPLAFLDAARAEFDEAVDWYEDQKECLGAEFVAQVDEVFGLIAVLPKVHPIVYRDVRRAVVKKFPYVVHYLVEDQRLLIVSVFHTSRDPSIWKARVP